MTTVPSWHKNYSSPFDLREQRRIAAALSQTVSCLPTEIWLEVLIWMKMSRQDLSRLCRVSSLILHITRPMLYRSLSLSSTQYDGQRQHDVPRLSTRDTLALLARNPDNLAAAVEELTLKVPSIRRRHFAAQRAMTEKPPTLIEAAALKNMTGLKRLIFRNAVFADEDEQAKDDFVAALREIDVEELLVYHDGATGLSPTQAGEMKDFRKFCWISSSGMSDEAFPEIFAALASSADTLTSLSLLFSTSEQGFCRKLSKLYFPHLRYLAAGNLAYDIPLPPAFDIFLANHSPTLEEIDFPYGEYNHTAMMFGESTLEVLRTDSLPSLKRFRGNMRCVDILARAHLRSFRDTLVSLTIGTHGVYDPKWDVAEMFRTLKSTLAGYGDHNSQPLRLEELNMDLSPWEDQELDFIRECIRDCAAIWGPSIRVWKGTLPSYMDWPADKLGQLFRPFEQLRVLCLPYKLLEKMEVTTEEYVRTIATQCKKLEEVRFRFHFEWSDWTITRVGDLGVDVSENQFPPEPAELILRSYRP